MIKRYFIVVLLLFLFPAGVSAQRRPAAKKDWKAKYDYVGAAHDGRILVHRGGEGSDPRMGRFYTDGCFGYTDTCGTVVIPLIYDYADSFSNGFAVVGKGEKNDRRFGLIDRQGREVVPCSQLKRIAFEKGAKLKIIPQSVFANLNSLTAIEIPASIELIEDGAFADCHSLTVITFEKNSNLKAIGNSTDVSMRMSPVFRQALSGCRRGWIPSAAMGMSIRWDRS